MNDLSMQLILVILEGISHSGSIELYLADINHIKATRKTIRSKKQLQKLLRKCIYNKNHNTNIC